ncbi:MFS transporter [Williamsia sp. CHRR-6]|uniref:MFS transporter n=1 Tax=Williamsia sp. CHRR-6 TaxID=2835871 RepID=UPI001BDADBB5|nr:MFS transporter [Williamsia sp. CHRR-6]MBT0566032.1 MFS transporter [Williamsia sp. CHRR-6]
MSATSHSRSAHSRSALWVVVLCWSLVIFDGYDLIVYGATIPALLREPGWPLTPDDAGHLGSLAFAGMLVGALCGGALADRFGRRRAIIGATLWFSVWTGVCGWATGPEQFGLMRFLAGLGLGALIPSANALTTEFVTPRWRSVVTTAMMSGVPLGGALASVVALQVIDDHGWAPLYHFGFLGLVLAAAAAVALPESPTWLRSRNHLEQAARIEANYRLRPTPTLVGPGPTAARTVLRRPYALSTALFVLATTATMFTWYGLGTWLPKLTRADARFDLGSDPVTYLLALNLGAVAVSGVTAWSATRFGALRVAVVAASAGALSLAALTTFPSSVGLVYGLLIIAGAGSHGTLCLVIAAIAGHYPDGVRGTALGASLGGGRIGAVIAPTAAGWILTRDPTSATGSIGLFAAASGVAAALLLLLYLRSARPQVQPTPVTAALAR